MKRIKQSVCCLLVLLVSATMLLGAAAAPNVDANIDNAMNFYRTELAESFQTGDLAADVWELLCLVQSGKYAEPEYQFMKTEGPALTDKSTPTDYAKKILTYILLEKDVTQLAGELAAMQNENGDFVRGEVVSATNTAFSVLALLAARAQDVEVSFDCDKAVAAITAQAKADKGYNDYGEEGNVDTTGMVLLGLAAAKENGCAAAASAVDAAASFLRSTLQDTGYFVGQGMYDCPNACSQAYGIIGLIAAGENMADAKWDASLKALLERQDPNGGFWYQAKGEDGQWPFAPDQMSTYQAMMALFDYRAQDSFLVSLTRKKASTPVSSELNPDSSSGDIEQPGSQGQESAISTVSPSSNSTLSTSNSNPKTGDTGISSIVWIVLGIAVVAVLVAVLVPVFSQKKKEKQNTDSTKQD